MVREVYLLIAFLMVAAVFSIRRIRIGVRQLRKYWGKMLITCPENQKTAAVEVASARAALRAMVGSSHTELCACTRWPEKQDCGQECLSQIESDPETHRLWTIASQWYAGKTCAFCHKPIGALQHIEHQAALLNPDKTTTEWAQVPPEKIPEAFAVSEAVCWSCHIVESFRREHPNWIVERPWTH